MCFTNTRDTNMSGTSGKIQLKEYFRAAALGEGSFGSVVTVYDDEGKECALKMFENDEENDTLDSGTLRELSILRLLREANGHPGLIPMIDIQERYCGGAGDMLSMAMPRYKVGDLQHLLDGGAFPKGPAGRKARIQIAHELLSGLAYLNDNAIMHRDVKADNVMLTNDLHAVLIDFSLAKIIDGPLAILPPGLTHTGEVGTATYSAPEVVAGEAYDTKTDAWSAGVVLLEMLNGHTLKVDKDSAAFRMIEEAKATLPNKPFANLIRGLLEVDPAKRLSCREALSVECFTKAGFVVPEIKLIDFTTCLPGPKDDTENNKNVTVDINGSSSSSSSSNSSNNSNSGAGGEKKRNRGKNSDNAELTRTTRMKKAIHKYCSELGCIENPNIEKAALLYANEIRRTGYCDVDVGSSIVLDCVVIAEKFFEPEGRDLEELEEDGGEEYPSFAAWELETYKENEHTIFAIMDYCLYLRGGNEDVGNGGRKKKARSK